MVSVKIFTRMTLLSTLDRIGGTKMVGLTIVSVFHSCSLWTKQMARLLPPGAVISTIRSTGSPNGRNIVYFGWLVKADGTIEPLPGYAPWLEEVLSGK